MKIFLDTSVWVKYFIEEGGTRELQDFILNKCDYRLHQFAASAVTYAEMHGTFKRALKGCDAFQLASALKINTEIFICSDKDLQNAAIDNGLTAWNPEEGFFFGSLY